MIKIVAQTLEEAYKKASVALDCSIIDLEIDILQSPSRGFFGFFAKEAIINAKYKDKSADEEKKLEHKRKIFSKSDSKIVEQELTNGLSELLENSCFKAYVSEVKILQNDKGVYIKIDGEDAALLIGKEGYRYKALSYIIYNWIKIKYNLSSTLEIASFLESQETMIESYLNTLDEKIKQQGRAQTKPLDGILVKLALENLRKRYPDKYVAIRTLKNGKKIIIVNEYKKG